MGKINKAIKEEKKEIKEIEDIKPKPTIDIKISSFICVTNAIKRGDTFIEAIKSHLYFSDELIVVDGGSTDGTVEAIQALKDNRIKIVTLKWPTDWCWSEFAKHWNYGYQHCTGDWVAAGESDHIFHEEDGEKIRNYLSLVENFKKPAVGVDKFQFTLANHYFSKSRFPYFLNKKIYKNQLGYGLDKSFFTDLAYPIMIEKQTEDYFYEGVALKEESVIRSPFRFYNYVWTFKTLDMITNERRKSSAGWNRYKPFKEIFNKTLPFKDEDVVKSIKSSMMSKYLSCLNIIPREKQPKIMQESLKKLKFGMYACDLCGFLEQIHNGSFT